MPAHGREADAAPEAIARARGLVEFLNASAERIEAGRALPADVVAALHAARMFRLLLPRSLGGDELHLKTLAQVTEVIGGADASTAWCLGQAAGCAMAAASLKPEVARRLFGPADAVLAWGAGIQGKAHAVDGGYRVTGKWTFASGCANATLLGGHSYIFEKDGTPRKRADGRQARPQPAVRRLQGRDPRHVAHAGAQGHGELHLRGRGPVCPRGGDHRPRGAQGACRAGHALPVPRDARLCGGLQRADARRRPVPGVGAQGACHDQDAARAPSSLKESPVFQTQLALLEARLRACRAYLHATLDEIWDKVGATREFTIEDAAGLKLATTYAINQGVEVATEAYRAAGQTAIFPTNPFERRLRDALTASQQMQGRPSNFITIGRVMLGLPPDTIFLR